MASTYREAVATARPRVVAIVQARMGSSRLPAKILKLLASKSVLSHVIARLKAMSAVDAVVIATTTLAADDAVVAEAKSCGAFVSRGSELDVLDRYYHAAREHNAEVIVRVTSDCPLIDPATSAAILSAYLARLAGPRPLAYLSNTIDRTYPRGFDTEVFSLPALERAWREGQSPAEREHVTPYLYRYPELFPQEQYRNNCNRSHYRLTLDTEEDYALLGAIFQRLDAGSRLVSGEEVIAFLDQHPEIAAINAHIEQKPLGR